MEKNYGTMSPADMTAVVKPEQETPKLMETSTAAPEKTAEVLTMTAATKSVASPEVANLEKLCDVFIKIKSGGTVTKKINSNAIMRGSSYSELAIKAFSRIINYVWNNQDNIKVLNAFRQFFVKYRDSYLSDTEAMTGINLITNPHMRNRISIMYMYMYELTNPNRTRIAFDYTRAASYCNNEKCRTPNGFIQYVASRMR